MHFASLLLVALSVKQALSDPPTRFPQSSNTYPAHAQDAPDSEQTGISQGFRSSKNVF